MKLSKTLFTLAVIALLALCASAFAEDTLQLPAGLEIIEQRAFYGSTSLQTATVPEGAREIGSEAFAYSSLSKITLPSTLTYIAGDAFEGCASLTIYGYSGSYAESYANENGIAFVDITPADVVAEGVWGDNITWTLDSDGVLTISGEGEMDDFDYYDDQAWLAYRDSIEHVTIGAGITRIGNYAFQYCENIVDVTIPDGISDIGYSAFQSCRNLSGIALPASLANIGFQAFNDCSSMAYINVDEDNPVYTSIDDILYNKSCSRLLKCPAGKSGSVAIPEGVEVIDYSAFSGCLYITGITLPQSLVTIGDGAFYWCENPDFTSIAIPAGVTQIGFWAFNSSRYLTAINVDADNPNYRSVEGVLYNKAGDTLLQYPSGKSDRFTVPHGVTRIGDGAFSECFELTELSLPDGLTEIGQNAFSNCFGLRNITIPDTVNAIGAVAFAYCSNLSSVTIPASVVSIGEVAFTGCEDLTIYGYEGSYAETYANENNISFVDIGHAYIVASGVWGDNLQWTLDSDDVLTISGEGEMGHFNYYDNQAWLEYRESIEHVVIEAGITGIGNYAFQYCENIVDVSIPVGVSDIGYSSFQYCSSLANISLPASLTNIDSWAFDGCSSMTYFNVNENNPVYTSINGILYNKSCSKLIECPEGKSDNIAIPESVTVIDHYAFHGCLHITGITLPQSLVTIGNYAFYMCENPDFTSIAIPVGVTMIGDSAFNLSRYLTAINVDADNPNYRSIEGVLYNKAGDTLLQFPNGKSDRFIVPYGVTRIVNGAFWGSFELTELSLPDGLTEIGSNAFANCTGLSSLTIPDTVTVIGGGAFLLCRNLTIYGYEGSYAESYANENNIPFVGIE